MLRVVHIATGQVGSEALRAILRHPGLELVGLMVNDPAKVGLDAGVLCGLSPVGVLATDDVGDLLQLRADCLCQCSTWLNGRRRSAAMQEAATFLAAGVNVVSVTVPPLVWPDSPSLAGSELADLRSAADLGQASFFTTGIDPGFATDVLPLVATSVCSEVESVRVLEIHDYSSYQDPDVIFAGMGFGRPVEAVPPYLSPAGGMMDIRRPVLEMLANALHLQLDDIRFHFQRSPALQRAEYANGAVIEQGTADAHWFVVEGWSAGKRVLTVEHVTRMQASAAPEWPQPLGDGSYKILIQGRPNLTLDFGMENEGDAISGGLTVTGARLVNSIPDVCAAPPGLLSALDVPFTPRPVA